MFKFFAIALQFKLIFDYHGNAQSDSAGSNIFFPCFGDKNGNLEIRIKFIHAGFVFGGKCFSILQCFKIKFIMQLKVFSVINLLTVRS